MAWRLAVRVTVLLAALALALVPGAQAMGLSADVRFSRGLALQGDVEVSSARGVLDLAPGAVPADGFSLRFSHAEGYVVTRERDYAGTPSTNVFLGTRDPRNATFALPGGTLEGLSCGSVECAILVYAAGDDAALSMSGRARGALEATREDRAYFKGIGDGPAEDSFYYRVEPGAILASPRPVPGLPATILAEAQSRATGMLELFLLDASTTWVSEAGAENVSAHATWGTREGPGGVPLGLVREEPFVVLRLHGAELILPAGSGAAFYAPQPLVEVAGLLRASEAQGVLVLDGRAHALAGASLEAWGRMQLAPASAVGLLGALPVSFLPVDAPLWGEASRVVVGGRALEGAPAPPVAATTVVTALSLAGLLAAVVCVKLAGVPFYMRVTRGSLLRNDNRRRLYEEVRARPGVAVAELMRETGLNEIVVRHHLRMLEAHRYVTLRGQGRLRGYFASDASADPEATYAHLVLKDATRRRLAELLAASSMPLTQSDLAERAGVSRRLVSHHLARLEEAGLVEGSGGMPRGYVPTVLLARFLEDGALAAV